MLQLVHADRSMNRRASISAPRRKRVSPPSWRPMGDREPVDCVPAAKEPEARFIEVRHVRVIPGSPSSLPLRRPIMFVAGSTQAVCW